MSGRGKKYSKVGDETHLAVTAILKVDEIRNPPFTTNVVLESDVKLHSFRARHILYGCCRHCLIDSYELAGKDRMKLGKVRGE